VGCLRKYNSQHLKRIKDEIAQYKQIKRVVEINCISPEYLLKQHNITDIDFCSIDVEGGEFDIIKAIDFNSVNIDVFAVENSYHDLNIKIFLAKKGYKLIKRLQCDEIYRKAHSRNERIYLRILSLKAVYPFLFIKKMCSRREIKQFTKLLLVKLGLWDLIKHSNAK